MEGIEILAQSEIMQSASWTSIMCISGIIMLFIGFVLLIIGVGIEYDVGIVSGCALFVFGAIVALLSVGLSETYKEPTGRYEYQVIIGENVSFTDIYSNYEVVDQNGLIWTIRDKEVGD
jgi:hypothetical protein